MLGFNRLGSNMMGPYMLDPNVLGPYMLGSNLLGPYMQGPKKDLVAMKRKHCYVYPYNVVILKNQEFFSHVIFSLILSVVKKSVR